MPAVLSVIYKVILLYIVAFLREFALSSYLKYADFALDYSYLLSGATDIDGEWSDAGFNTGGKNQVNKNLAIRGVV